VNETKVCYNEYVTKGGGVMDKRTMQFKLLSYKQALRKSYDNDDKNAIKNWTEEIVALQKQIEGTV